MLTINDILVCQRLYPTLNSNSSVSDDSFSVYFVMELEKGFQDAGCSSGRFVQYNSKAEDNNFAKRIHSAQGSQSKLTCSFLRLVVRVRIILPNLLIF